MHELTIAKNIVDSVSSIAIERNYGQVSLIRVEIGVLSGVVSESLAFCFPLAAEGSVLKDSRLEIINKPLQIHCLDCGTESSSQQPLLYCNHCQSCHVDVRSGEQMIIKSIEVT